MLIYSCLLPDIVKRLNAGDLKTVGLGEGPRACHDTSKSFLKINK